MGESDMLKNVIKTVFVTQLLLATPLVFANTYNFSQITSNGNQLVAPQLSVNVTQSGSNALFTFFNSSVIASSITDAYFDYGNTNYFTSVSNNILGSAGESASVSYTDGATPPNLPDGNTIGFSAMLAVTQQPQMYLLVALMHLMNTSVF